MQPQPMVPTGFQPASNPPVGTNGKVAGRNWSPRTHWANALESALEVGVFIPSQWFLEIKKKTINQQMFHQLRLVVYIYRIFHVCKMIIPSIWERHQCVNLMMIDKCLGGGNSNILFIFIPIPAGNESNLMSICFQMGWNPPTSQPINFCWKKTWNPIVSP